MLPLEIFLEREESKLEKERWCRLAGGRERAILAVERSVGGEGPFKKEKLVLP